MTIWVYRTQIERNDGGLILPQLKFLAAELVQQGFIFKEAAFPLFV